ncbi:MAG: phenylacetate--CoA ligase family protein, partial [Verrucomicrobiota bacterium]
IVNPATGVPVADGEPGEIVFTSLDSRGSVVLRYRTGDQIEKGITYEPCEFCGRSVPRLLGKITRVSDVRRISLGKVKGTLVNFSELEHLLDDFSDIGSWQIELRKRNDDPYECDELFVHLHHTNGREPRALSHEIERRFIAVSEIKPNAIKFHTAAEMRHRQGVGRELKEQRFVDNRTQPSKESAAS